METFICLLRSVNVSGVNLIKMAELKTFWESLGFTEVKTYIQSGNIVFKSEHKGDIGFLEKSIEEKFTTKNVSVILKTPEELQQIIANNPFANEPDFNPKINYVSFLQATPEKQRVEQFNTLTFGEDLFIVAGDVLYLKYAGGAGNSKLTNKVIEKHLGVQSTARNWNTTNKLAELSK